jgi:hypothetical protein
MIALMNFARNHWVHLQPKVPVDLVTRDLLQRGMPAFHYPPRSQINSPDRHAQSHPATRDLVVQTLFLYNFATSPAHGQCPAKPPNLSYPQSQRPSTRYSEHIFQYTSTL